MTTAASDNKIDVMNTLAFHANCRISTNTVFSWEKYVYLVQISLDIIPDGKVLESQQDYR